jgi:hypothetical protein
MHALNAFATGLNDRAEYEISRTPIYLRKTYVTDICFGREPDIAALADATAKAYGVSSSSFVSGWFPGDTVHRAYRAPDVSVFWMKNYDQPGAFPLE